VGTTRNEEGEDKSLEMPHLGYTLQYYDGDTIPPTAIIEMMELPGIGPTMAFIIESVAWGNVTGIGIDTHMHRMYVERTN
jgi:endonuclease III